MRLSSFSARAAFIAAQDPVISVATKKKERGTGHTIQPSTRKLATLDDLSSYAADAGITIPAEIKDAC
jgi:hypothetical protein